MSTIAIIPEPMVLPVQQMDGAEHEQLEAVMKFMRVV